MDSRQWCRVLGTAASNRDKLMPTPRLLSLPLTRQYVCESGAVDADLVGIASSGTAEVESDADDGESAQEHSSDSGDTVGSEELGDVDMLALKREWLGRAATTRKAPSMVIPLIRDSSSEPTRKAQVEHRRAKRTRMSVV